MSQQNDSSLTPPQDVYERDRLANLHPAEWRNPTPADCYQLVIVGAGPAGLAAAETAASLGAKVALTERHLMGGDCLNVGCIPSKSIIRTSRLNAEMRDANRYGAQIPGDIRVDFASVMERMRSIRAHLSGGDSVRRLIGMGVDVFFGEVRFAGFDSLTVKGEKLGSATFVL